jgi:hypothetical protein
MATRKLTIHKQKIKIIIMTQHYRLMQSDPSAIILAKNPQSGSLEETKIYKKRGTKGEDVIYLSDKQSFAFKFFNPLKEKIGIQITMNGKSDGNLLVANPGQSINLERFLNESRKMIFETYSIDSTNEAAVSAIQNNGDIQIDFFKEETPTNDWDTAFTTFHSQNSNSRVYGSSGTYSTLSNTNGMGNVRCCGASLDAVDYSDYVGENLEKNIEHAEYQAETVETGRVERGENSDQNLEKVEIEFKTTPFLTQLMKLMPVSQAKTYTKTDVNDTRNYCPSCRYRVRNQSWIFCPKCGNDLA